jgi:hypothetical protein
VARGGLVAQVLGGGRREFDGVMGKAPGKEKSTRAHRGDGSTRADKKGWARRCLMAVRDPRWLAVDVGDSYR